MSAAAVEHPHEEQLTLLEAADLISSRLPGHRVEIVGGQIAVTPPANVTHSRTLTCIMKALPAAGLHDERSEVHQAVGMWLPDGPSSGWLWR